MNTDANCHIKVRVHELGDSCQWELLTSDGTPIEGWYLISVGQDQSGRNSLHVAFDNFECVNAEGQPVEVKLTGPTSKARKREPRLPSARTHRRPRH